MTNQVELPGKKEQVLRTFFRYLTDQKIGKGDKILSERELAARCQTSRATIREIVKSMEARGLFTVKRGSGIYLAENPQLFLDEFFKDPLQPHHQIQDILETAYSFYPLVLYFAILRKTPVEINRLQDHIVHLSRGILEKDHGKIIDRDRLFYTTISKMSKNQYIINFISDTSISHALLWKQILNLGDFALNTIFASYIEITHAIQDGQTKKAIQQLRQKFRFISTWLTQRQVIPSDTLQNDISTQIFSAFINNPKEES